jgi:uncharacterized protein YecT (DUF1311 family)
VGSLSDWIHLEAIQALIHHASAVIAAIFLFGVTARLIAYLIPDGYAKNLVIIIDDIILLSVFALAGWRLLVYMWVRPEWEENPARRIQVTQTHPKTEVDAIDAVLAQCRAVAAKTGGQMQQCLQQKFEQAEQALGNAGVRMKAAMGALDQAGSTKTGATNSFDEAQQAFLQYREAECRWHGTAAGAGNAANFYQACVADLTAWRAAQIDQLLGK